MQDHDQFVIMLLNGVGDYIDLRYVINPRLRPDFHRMSLQQIKQYIADNGHCSVLVKVLGLLGVPSTNEAPEPLLHWCCRSVVFGGGCLSVLVIQCIRNEAVCC